LPDPFADPFARQASGASRERRPRGDGRHIPGEIGIWVFVLGDMLIFGLFFIVFLYERARHVALFEQAHGHMLLAFGAVNTLVLLTGSLFVVLGVGAIRRGDARYGQRMILLTLLCGAAFVVSKYLEYSGKLAAGETSSANVFYMYYFVFTGIHLVHLLLGVGFLAIMYRVAKKPVLGVRDVAHIEVGACFWHLIDLLWIVLFALLYLVR
jgi:nitric oxide reductase NorE protein